jgi:hypothetical protein
MSTGVAPPLSPRRQRARCSGDDRLATRLSTSRPPARDGLCILGGAAFTSGGAARYLGLLAATAGRPEAAVGHLEDALATNMRAQAPPWVARTLLDLARALLARDGPATRIALPVQLQRAQVLATIWGCARSRSR